MMEREWEMSLHNEEFIQYALFHSPNRSGTRARKWSKTTEGVTFGYKFGYCLYYTAQVFIRWDLTWLLPFKIAPSVVEAKSLKKVNGLGSNKA